MKDLIFIEGSIPSSKNSKQWTGKFLVTSKTVQKYLKKYEYQWKVIPPSFSNLKPSDYPILVGIHFVRGTKHRFDYHNGVQLVADLMVNHSWIIDDNMDYFFPMPMKIEGKYYSYSKENPGVYIQIIKTNISD